LSRLTHPYWSKTDLVECLVPWDLFLNIVRIFLMRIVHKHLY
jgi:hypothetical protein